MSCTPVTRRPHRHWHKSVRGVAACLGKRHPSFCRLPLRASGRLLDRRAQQPRGRVGSPVSRHRNRPSRRRAPLWPGGFCRDLAQSADAAPCGLCCLVPCARISETTLGLDSLLLLLLLQLQYCIILLRMHDESPLLRLVSVRMRAESPRSTRIRSNSIMIQRSCQATNRSQAARHSKVEPSEGGRCATSVGHHTWSQCVNVAAWSEAP